MPIGADVHLPRRGGQLGRNFQPQDAAILPANRTLCAEIHSRADNRPCGSESRPTSCRPHKAGLCIDRLGFSPPVQKHNQDALTWPIEAALLHTRPVYCSSIYWGQSTVAEKPIRRFDES